MVIVSLPLYHQILLFHRVVRTARARRVVYTARCEIRSRLFSAQEARTRAHKRLVRLGRDEGMLQFCRARLSIFNKPGPPTLTRAMIPASAMAMVVIMS